MNEKNLPTRYAFGDEILEIAQKNKDIIVIDCDIAKSCMTLPFAAQFPKQHINVGIAEQNACGLAAGLATCKKIPFIATYAVFGSMRICEQIRQSVCYPNLNVKIACSHGGLTPAIDGASHQGIEDYGVLRSLPNMKIVMPADYNSARRLIRAAAEIYGPVYLRFTRDTVPKIYEEDEEFEIGKAKHLVSGNDVAIFANGDTVSIALKATRSLQEKGISVDLYDFHTIKPLDEETVRSAIEKCGCICTVEDHNIIGGLGTAVCEIAAEMGNVIVRRIGIQDCFGESAPYKRLLEKHGITVEHIEQECKKLVERKKVE